MRWTAIVPYKANSLVKSRLAPVLDREDRNRLATTLLAHLQETLSRCSRIDRCLLVSKERCSVWAGDWLRDPGRGLNAALEAGAEMAGRPLLVIHGDLPLVTPDDLNALLDVAEREGIAIAPDRHETGTNAVALCDNRTFSFMFGRDSKMLHLKQLHNLRPCDFIVNRLGFQLDCDTPQDIEIAKESGWSRASEFPL
ncbi:2-phospho-L-lactate guanylyltransferase [Novosphingobium marinum]|uniref:2-phospho-L-lactate guanylyltransferase n=1 Tax=Novosphingobium marinum TaxID=1514948 RepID=A0A7Z0BUT5_9SPHN|nr:2-phospho-L-lactate guanylyltransferase [Novosphingobium marinum]NYH95523.1 2-phospho-L-lactate guanylyltransferase [Novosphingobium marinum]